MRKTSRIMEIAARCQTCGEGWHMNNAQAVAARHAKAHGHYVQVIVERHYEYDGTA